MENSLTDAKAPDDKEGLLSVTDLCRMFEESEESTLTARGESERDRDYYDSIQYTSTELAVMKKRGQPPVVDNRIKTKIDYLVGLEKSQRIDPRALPRTPAHEEDADAASKSLKYVADEQFYDQKRSAVWKNLLIEGSGGISVAVEPSKTYQGGYDIVLRHWAWDRMFADPHSSELDYSDAGYLGGVVWMDYADALAMYPGSKEILDATMSDSGAQSRTYDDKPKFRLWADRKRKRVRVCQIWIKRNEQWYFAEFTKGGILKDKDGKEKAGPSPYVDDKGQSDCEMFFQAAYKNRDNEVYGLVREMVSLQDSINKRGSKSLHLLNTAQMIFERGTFDNPEAARIQAAKPDGQIEVNTGHFDKFKLETRLDLAEGHFKLLQDAKNSIDLKGPNATMMGDKAQGSSSASGRAILASQQGGMIQLGDLIDGLRHLDHRVFRAIWNRIRQFWTEERWIRVTDEEKNVKWVGMNLDPERMQMLVTRMQQSPEQAQRIAGFVGNVAELDCDIIIDAVPDSVTPALEQWQGLVDLAKAGIPIPPKVLIRSAPNLKNKDELIDELEKAQQNQPPNPAAAKAMADVEAKKALTAADIEAKQAETQADIQNDRAKTIAKIENDRAIHQNNMALQGNVEIAQGQNRAQGLRAEVQPIAEIMGSLERALTAPKRVVRDPRDGRVVGVETVLAEQQPEPEPPMIPAMQPEQPEMTMEPQPEGQPMIPQGM